MVGDVMILMRENPISRLLEGVEWALKIETFLGPEMATSEASAIGTQKSGVGGVASLVIVVTFPTV